MTIRHVGRRLLAGLAVLVLAAGCAGSASLTPTPTPGPTATATAMPTPLPTVATATAPAAAATTLPPAAHRPQTIHVLEDPHAFQVVHVAGCTGDCAGDQLIGHSRMIDAATHKGVGSFSVKCVLIDPGQALYHCPANVISLTGRGQIVFDETVCLGAFLYTPKPWPIISGSGEFLGATGSVAIPKDSTWDYGDFVITITG